MRMAIDITVLGRGVLDHRNRTGIHRVVLDLLRCASSEPSLETILCATSPGALAPALVARAEHPIATAMPFPATPRGRAGGAMAQRVAAWGDRFARSPRLHGLARKATSLVERTLWLLAPPIPASTLSGLDIYLSPFDPLPPRRLMPGVRRAVMVYDLIPLLYPHLSREGGALRRILSSVRDEDLVLTISESSRSDLVGMGLRPDRVSAIPLFADPTIFRASSADAPAPRPSSEPAPPYLLALGNLEPRKNLSMALRAFDQVCGESPFSDHRLVLAGTRTPGHAEAIPPRVADRVVFAGRVPDEALGALYRGATAFLFPSFYEGFGLPVLEAMQCGVPVIASNRSSIPEVAGDAALLVSPDDLDAFSSALRRILSDPELRQEMSLRGIARAKEFSRERFARDLSRALGLPSSGQGPA